MHRIKSAKENWWLTQQAGEAIVHKSQELLGESQPTASHEPARIRPQLRVQSLVDGGEGGEGTAGAGRREMKAMKQETLSGKLENCRKERNEEVDVRKAKMKLSITSSKDRLRSVLAIYAAAPRSAGGWTAGPKRLDSSPSR